jgi:branched-chain amino acid transport system substrate-binding protein
MVAACAAAAAALALGACGEDDSGGGGDSACISGNTLSVYSSLPFDPTDRKQSEDIVDGEKLALQQAGNKVGKWNIKYVSLDDATPAAGKWEAGKTSSNARQAAQDETTIAYVGEFNSGASAVAMPILNRSGILQVSPANTYLGLTKKTPDPSEPAKYRPTGKKTYGRVVPADNIQAAAQVTYMKDNGVTRLYVLNDKEVYGKGIANEVEKAAKALGIEVVANEEVDPKSANFRTVANKLKSSGANGMFFGGITANGAAQLWKDVYAAAPQVKLFGPDGVAQSDFTEALGPSQRQTYVTNPTLDPKLYPPAAQQFFTDFETKYGNDRPEPYAIYGYEAMSAVLQALKAAGDKANCRQDVIDAFYAIKDRDSVLGTYSIDPDGDTTLSDYGGNRVRGDQLVFDKVIKAQTSR